MSILILQIALVESLRLPQQHNLLDRSGSGKIHASIPTLSCSCFLYPAHFCALFHNANAPSLPFFLFSENLRFRLHICKASILILPLAAVGTSPLTPNCDFCSARPRRHWKTPSVCLPLGILLLPFPREKVCSV